MIRVLPALPVCFAFIAASDGQEALDRAFYLPENPRYTIVESALDSIRFTLDKTVRRDERGHLVSISSFVDPEGSVMGWHDFGQLEGPGWAANAVGGAYEIYRMGSFLGRKDRQEQARSILDHVLEGGFIDAESGFIRGYRETTTDRLCLNYKHNSDWFCPGSMAKVAFQLLLFADVLDDDPRAQRMRDAAVRCAAWIDRNVESVPNGWFPRRVTPEGKVYRKSPDGGDDAFWQASADGLFILQLQAALIERGLADYREELEAKTAAFIRSGGIFGSINHDTYDPHENVAYAVAFRTLLPASRVLRDESLRAFAYRHCLAGLDPFKMTEDRNGVATRGLLFMEKSWDTAYLWENAEAALAWFEAAVDCRTSDPQRSRQYELDGLTVLRAAAKHHYGPHGFLTEGVDWNNHVGQQHHIDQALYGGIRYTEPFLNNQHIAEPTLYYLEHLALKTRRGDAIEYRDCEGNLLIWLSAGESAHRHDESPEFSWLPPAPKLPPPEGQVIRVAGVEELFSAARDIRPGGTILIADGHYLMPRYFELSTDRVTLRSASGDRDKVVLDGARSRHGELVGVRACSGVTIADLTIQNIRYNGFKLNSNTGVHHVTIRNCVIHNIWQRGVKGVRVPPGDPQVTPPRGCRIEHCLFYNDRPKRFEDDPTDTPDSFNGNYIGGIDVMYADGWTIRDNVFFGIRGRTGEARGAVFLWHDSADCVVERNVIVDCDTGICLGNSHRGPDTKIHCRRSVVRNNFVTRCPENAILADYTEGCLIAHNTIHDPASRLKRLIRLVHDNQGLAVVNNLLSGPPMRVETQSRVRFEGNVTRDVAGRFVDVAKGDLHLMGDLPEEVGQAAAIAEVPEDFDREPRRSSTDVGADQGR